MTRKRKLHKWLHSPLIKPINAIKHQSTVPADCYVPRHLKVVQLCKSHSVGVCSPHEANVS